MNNRYKINKLKYKNSNSFMKSNLMKKNKNYKKHNKKSKIFNNNQISIKRFCNKHKIIYKIQFKVNINWN